jgi:excisionase family DNA binding protein
MSRMSVAQVAERWGCSRQHIYNLINRGTLPTFRIGSLIRLREEDVTQYEDLQLQAAPVAPEPVSVTRIVPQASISSAHLGYWAGQRSLQKRRRG